MRVLDRQFDLVRFFSQVARANTRTLFLDYDGTIAPFTADPSKAYAYPGILSILQRFVGAGHTRIVFVSGRQLVDLTPLLPLAPLPELWGSHGYEHLAPGRNALVFPLSASSQTCLDLVRTSLNARLVGVHLETKPASIAVHWRGDSEQRVAQIRHDLNEIWTAVEERGAVIMEEFDGGMEFKARDRNKGHAVRDSLGATEIAAYLGDDVTDEDGFRAVAQVGVGVLVRPQLRRSSASVWIRAPAEVETFLLDWEASCMGVLQTPSMGKDA